MTAECHIALPPERFFWAVVDAPGWRRPGPVPEGVLAAAADEFPLEMERLFAVGAPATGGAAVICAVRRDLLASIDPGAVSLTPETLPAFVAGRCAPGALNLLRGPYEPRLIRRARARAFSMIAGTVVLGLALCSLGLLRRAESWRSEARRASSEAREILLAASPAGGDLRSEIDGLRAVARAQQAQDRPADAALVLAEVLSGWPHQIPCVAHSIAVGEGHASLSLSVDGDPSAFLGTLRPPPGWALDEPRLNTVDATTRLSLRLRPREAVHP